MILTGNTRRRKENGASACGYDGVHDEVTEAGDEKEHGDGDSNPKQSYPFFVFRSGRGDTHYIVQSAHEVDEKSHDVAMVIRKTSCRSQVASASQDLNPSQKGGGSFFLTFDL